MIKHTDVVEGLKQIQSESVDCIILDPPYNIGKDYGNNKTNLQTTEYISWAQQWLTECERILKPDGTMYVYGFSEILAHLSVNISLNQRWLIWHYTNKTVPRLNFWQRTHESILCCWKEEKSFFRDQVRVPYTDTFLKNAAGKKRKNTKGRFGNKETIYTAHDNGALPRDVICSPSLAGGAGLKERFFYSPSHQKLYTSKQVKEMNISDVISHPTQKPTKVTEILLDACIEKGGLAKVVIPFAGTGSECYVCDTRNYNWVGFEINEDFVDMGNTLVKNGFPQNNKGKK
jgi:site-specific DNA-methyltransferase (adenine-specific)